VVILSVWGARTVVVVAFLVRSSGCSVIVFRLVPGPRAQRFDAVAKAHPRRHEERHQHRQGYGSTDHASHIGWEKGDHSINIDSRLGKVNLARSHSLEDAHR
jgi:hypothetical protein